MRLGQDVLSDLDRALGSEWLIANGLGGSASGTATGAHTRSTHAHLVVAAPHGRLTTALLKLDERVVADGASFELGTDLRVGGAVRPAGHRLLEDFRLDPWPVWRYRTGEARLEKSLFLIHGHHAAAIGYRLLAGPETRVTVCPLLVSREPWAIQRETEGALPAVQGMPGRVRVETRPGSSLSLWHNGVFIPARAWQRQLFYKEDGAAGRETGEDALVVGYIEATLVPGSALHLIASTEEDLFRALANEDRLGATPPRTLAECTACLEAGERKRDTAWRRAVHAGATTTARDAAAAHARTGAATTGEGVTPARTGETAPGPAGVAPEAFDPTDELEPWIGPLAMALQMGLMRRGSRLALVSTLPRALEHGAEALRAVGALVAVRGFEAAREVLRGHAEYLNEGLAPETFDPEDGTPRYGDPAPALWLVIISELYARRSHDLEFARESLYPALEQVMHFYRSGTRRGIRVDQDGLLATGEGDAASKRSDLNALWYYAQLAMAHLARALGRRESAAFYLAWAREHQQRVNESLWDQASGCLFRELREDGPVAGVDAGQLFAIGLGPPLLPPDRAAQLLETIERALWTPLGLRPSPRSRQVTTLGWGTFAGAYLRVRGRSSEAETRVRGWLETLGRQLDVCGRVLLPEGFELEGEEDGLVPEGPAPVKARRRASSASRAGAIETRARNDESAGPGAGELKLGPVSPAAPAELRARSAGEPVSIVAAADLLRAWVEELDHTRVPVGAGSEGL